MAHMRLEKPSFSDELVNKFSALYTAPRLITVSAIEPFAELHK
jgi:hypothetical protein